MSELTFTSIDDRGFTMWSGIYFHGRAAEDLVLRNISKDEEGFSNAAPDLVAANVSKDALRDGIHTGTLYGEPVIAYLWTVERGGPGFTQKIGLICLESDGDSRKYAAKRYTDRAQWL